MARRGSALWRRLLQSQAPWWGPLACVLAVVCGWGLGLWVRHLRAADLREQQAQLDQLEPEQAQALLRQMQRWERMSSQQRKRILQLHQQVEADPQREQLLEAMDQFHRWLIQVPLGIQYDVLNDDSSAQQRVEQFRQLYLQWLGSRRLTRAELEVLVAWWRKQLVAQRLIDPDKLPPRLPPLPPARGNAPASRRAGFPPGRRLWELMRRGLMERSRERFFHNLRNFLQKLDDEAYEDLIRSWPEETAQQWNFACSREEKRILVYRWTTGTFIRRFYARHSRSSDQQMDQLVRRFQQLPSWAKARLLELPPEQFFEELQAYSQEEGPRHPRPGAHPPVPRSPRDRPGRQ